MCVNGLLKSGVGQSNEIIPFKAFLRVSRTFCYLPTYLLEKIIAKWSNHWNVFWDFLELSFNLGVVTEVKPHLFQDQTYKTFYIALFLCTQSVWANLLCKIFYLMNQYKCLLIPKTGLTTKELNWHLQSVQFLCCIVWKYIFYFKWLLQWNALMKLFSKFKVLPNQT